MSTIGHQTQNRTGGTGHSFFDEVESLSFATTKMVLGLIFDQSNDAFNSVHFRNRLYAYLKDSDGLGQTLGVDLSFKNFENTSDLEVYHLQDGVVQPFPLDRPVGFWAKLGKKTELGFRRFGPTIIFNVLLVALLSMAITFVDLSRWYNGRTSDLAKHWSVYVLLFANVTAAFILYLYLGETGKIRYDSIINAVLIAVAPLALMRTTFFETKGGSEIGLAGFYDRFLMWVNEKLMMSKYKVQQTPINIIAYHNTVDRMRSILRQLYQHARTVAQRQHLEKELEQELTMAHGLLERRRVCAKRLMFRFTWEELIQKGVIPESFQSSELIDPERIIKSSADFIMEDLTRLEHLRNLVEARLGVLEEMFRKDHEEVLEETIEQASSQKSVVLSYLRFFFIHLGCDTQKLINEGLLPKNFNISEPDLVNKRAFPRLRVQEPVAVTILNEDGRVLDSGKGELEDFSRSGALLGNLCLENKNLPAGQSFNVSFEFTDDAAPSDRSISARLVRLAYSEEGKPSYGLTFEALMGDDMKAISSYFASRSAKQTTA